MRFSLFHNRRKDLLTAPWPADWIAYLDANFTYYRSLTEPERATLRGIARVIIDEKNWEGCKGLTITDEMTVAISAQAALLLLGMAHNYYANVESILVYPFDYVAVETTRSADGIVNVGPSVRAGEAWDTGPVILSWPDVLAGGRRAADGHNVVYHEFAHKLDYRNGSADGVPLLKTQAEYERWAEVMSREYEELVRDSATGHPTLLNKYGATNSAEFFAVTTECFFERGADLRAAHPNLYEIFRNFYKQDPAGR